MSSSTISTAEIQDIVERLKHQHFRDTTRVTYYSIWKQFFIRLDDRPKRWEDRIILFLGHLIGECHLQSSTVRTYLSAIRAVLAEDEIQLKENHFLVSSLTKACRLKNDTIITRLPIHKELLHRILKELDKWADEENQPYLKVLYRAIFVSSYYGLLRVGEVAQSPHSITVNNVQIGVNKMKLLFILKSSKTHSEADPPQMVKINSTPINRSTNTTANRYCPYKLVDDYSTTRPHVISDTEQFFVFSDCSPVTPEQVRAQLRLMIERIGLDSSLYNVHSMRIGHCSDLLKYGVSVETIKKIGRWKSNAVFHYFRN